MASWAIEEEDTGKETGLPLIVCPTCKRERVIELIVRTTDNGNQGRVFFKCPRNVPNVSVVLCHFDIFLGLVLVEEP
jgi:hypothetical protein